MSYQKGPSENTLTINTTHQMLSYFENKRTSSYSHSVAFSPTRKWENLRGYDVRTSFLKTTVFQYKRPKIPDSSKAFSKKKRRFSLSRSQWLTLLLLFEPGQAFFTLPEVMTESDLSKCRDKTVFVDVYGILPNTSLAYVPPNSCYNGITRDFLLGKIRNGSKYPIHPDYVYGWKELYEGLEDCTIGLQMGTSAEPTEDFQQFENRIEQLEDLAEEEWWKERLRDISRQQRDEYRELYTKIAEASLEHPEGDIYGIDPLESYIWNEVAQQTPSNTNKIDDKIGILIDSERTMKQIEDRIDELEETDTDPTTYRLKSSKINVFGE